MDPITTSTPDKKQNGYSTFAERDGQRRAVAAEVSRMRQDRMEQRSYRRAVRQGDIAGAGAIANRMIAVGKAAGKPMVDVQGSSTIPDATDIQTRATSDALNRSVLKNSLTGSQGAPGATMDGRVVAETRPDLGATQRPGTTTDPAYADSRPDLGAQSSAQAIVDGVGRGSTGTPVVAPGSPQTASQGQSVVSTPITPQTLPEVPQTTQQTTSRTDRPSETDPTTMSTSELLSSYKNKRSPEYAARVIVEGRAKDQATLDKRVGNDSEIKNRQTEILASAKSQVENMHADEVARSMSLQSRSEASTVKWREENRQMAEEVYGSLPYKSNYASDKTLDRQYSDLNKTGGSRFAFSEFGGKQLNLMDLESQIAQKRLVDQYPELGKTMTGDPLQNLKNLTPEQLKKALSTKLDSGSKEMDYSENLSRTLSAFDPKSYNENVSTVGDRMRILYANEPNFKHPDFEKRKAIEMDAIARILSKHVEATSKAKAILDLNPSSTSP